MNRLAKVAFLAAALLVPRSGGAAVGCTLNDPDRDIKRMFPQSTGYTTTFVTIKEKGGEAMLKVIEARLGDKLDPVYESPDVPYAYYTVLKGKEAVGFVHGVNQKGTYGGMQLILATDLNGKIRDFYYQKMSSPEASVFRSDAFTKQLKGLSLSDFVAHDLRTKGERTTVVGAPADTVVKGGNEADRVDRLAQIKDPSKKSRDDFLNTLRGVKKNLILLDVFKPAGAAGEMHAEPGKEGESNGGR